MKIQTLKPKIKIVNQSIGNSLKQKYKNTYVKRMTGRKLQDRRLKMWSANPYCVECKRLTVYPDGFQLDHIIPLYLAGEDTEDNCQVLCIECHDKKTQRDLGNVN